MRILFKTFFIILSLGLAGCMTGTYSMEELHKNQFRIEAKVDKLAEEIEASEARDDRVQERIAGIEELLEQHEELLSVHGGPKIVSRENGALWGSLKNSDHLKAQEKKQSAKQQFAKIDSIHSPDELYSAAESFFDRGNYKYAILTYQEFINKHPGDSRVPRANLKQGYALIKIGRRKEAQYFLETIVVKFPKSSEAQIASNKLTELRR
ncbi:MAG: tetratricopeptide repeat protein [Deltaproteobacteria bacterium]